MANDTEKLSDGYKVGAVGGASLMAGVPAMLLLGPGLVAAGLLYGGVALSVIGANMINSDEEKKQKK